MTADRAPLEQTKRAERTFGTLVLAGATVLAIGLIAYYLRGIWPFVTLRADILMWSETDFIGNVIKLRTGTPLYTAPSDSNSLIYTPAASVLSWAIAELFGRSDSVPALRMVQLGYVAAASGVATLCWWKLLRIAHPQTAASLAARPLWFVFSASVLVLAATSPEVNRYAHCLHTDALALLISMLAFLAMLHYHEAPSRARVLLLAVAPALGYFTKQFLIAWAGVAFVYVIFRTPRRIDHIVLLVVAAGAGIAAAMGFCVAFFGENFVFWTFEVMGGARSRISLGGDFDISLARSVDHVIRAWPELAVGLAGGWLLLRGERVREVGPLWLGWLALVGAEAFSSGAGWAVLYHFGPGVVVGTVFLLASLPAIWPGQGPLRDAGEPGFVRLLAPPLLAAAGVFTLFIALRVVPSLDPHSARWFPGRTTTADLERYVSDIEREFNDTPGDRVLLDVGNWVYLEDGVVMRDRAISLGDQPLAGIYENFEVMKQRIANHAYDKILVRNLDSPFFLYDWDMWPQPSGVRAALTHHYELARTIPAPEGDWTLPPSIMFTGDVSVLVPRTKGETTP